MKNKDGLTAVMDAMMKLHQETHEMRGQLDMACEREESWIKKLEGAETRIECRTKLIASKDKQLIDLRRNLEEAEQARDEAINSKATVEKLLVTYQTLLERLLEPKEFLQIKANSDGSVVLNSTKELGEAVKFAQQAAKEDTCKWVTGYKIEEGISTLNSDAPDVLAECAAGCARSEE